MGGNPQPLAIYLFTRRLQDLRQVLEALLENKSIVDDNSFMLSLAVYSQKKREAELMGIEFHELGPQAIRLS